MIRAQLRPAGFAVLLALGSVTNMLKQQVFAGETEVTTLAATPIDSLKIRRIMDSFNIPGAAIGIIQHNQVIAAQGFGLKRIGKPDTVDANTIFKIASNTKAFTAAALAILADEGKISWDGKVRDYLPQFKMFDPWVTEHFTVLDLLTHRSGLGLGAGDLMLWPEPSSFTRQEVLHNLRFLKPSGEFRADYAYDNLLYIVAGEIIPAVAGKSWEAFVEQRIFRPLGMDHCFAGRVNEQFRADVAIPHGMVNGQLQTIERQQDHNKPSVSAAAGGIQCSLNDMLKWVKLQLNQGQISDQQRLFSLSQHRMMWQPHTLMPLSERSKSLDNSHFSAYGLGWRINDMNGFLQIHHTGSLAGMYSFVSLFPELDLGFVVLTNQQSSSARSALMYTVMKPYLGDETSDWQQVFSRPAPQADPSSAAAAAVPANTVRIDQAGIQDFIGTYDDNWLGRFIIAPLSDNKRAEVGIRSLRVAKFVGRLYHLPEKDSLLIRWDDRSLEADAIITLQRNNADRVVGMRMLPASADIDFSYDFQDLDFVKVQN